MFWKILPTRRLLASVLWLIVVAIAVSAQSSQSKEQPAKGVGNSTLSAEIVKTGLFVIAGGGCNSVLRLSANGFILVDGKLPGNYEAILAKTRKVSFSEQPIRLLINTDYHRITPRITRSSSNPARRFWRRRTLSRL